MKGNGSLISNTGLVRKYGLMGRCSTVSIKTVLKMATAYSNGRITTVSKEILNIIKWKEKVSTSGRMVRNSWAAG